MKKTAVALAVAGMVAAPLAAMADTTVYGSVRISELWTDRDDVTNPGTGAVIEGDDFWDTNNESSRLGFRGAEDLGNGLAAIYHYEFGVDASDTADIGGTNVGGRLSYVGLKGGFGQLTVGRQWNPYYWAVGGEVDVFNSVGSSLGYYNNSGVTRDGNMLVYYTPSWSGLTLGGAIETDGEAGNNNVDVWQVAATYDNGPLFLGAGWRQTDSETAAPLDPDADDFDQYGIQGRWNIGAFGIAGSWQRTDDGDTERDGYDLVGSFDFGNNRVRLGYFDVEDDSDGWIVGLQHNFSKRSRVYIEYNDVDVSQNDRFDQNGTITAADADTANLAIGMRHDF